MDNDNIILETKRTYLHQFTKNEANDLFELNNDPIVLKYTGDPPFIDKDDALSFIDSYSEYERNGFGRWAVRLKENNNFIGWCGLKKHENNEIDLGFRFKQAYWNQGYATETALACIDYVRQNDVANYLIGRAMPENSASIRVLEKIGMSYWKEIVTELHPAVCYKIEF